MKQIASWYLLCVSALVAGVAGEAAAADDVPIVYARCARSDATVEFSGDVLIGGVTRRVTRTMTGLDAYDVLPDVTNFFRGFSAPCDLVYRDAEGNEDILYDCSSTSTDEAACAALDPAVSYDGRTIAFAVFRGPLTRYREGIANQVLDPTADAGYATNVTPEFFPNRRLQATEAQLHLVDVASGTVTELPGVEGEFDSGPTFLPDGRLAFTSTRDGHHVTSVWGTGDAGRGNRTWTMDVDGRNLDIASHHSLALEQHPYVLRDGRVAYSSWQLFGGLPFRHTNGSLGGFTTLGNLFHLYTQAPDGAGNFAFYGQHSGDHYPSYFGSSHDAAHFISQTSDGRVWVTDYYRGNNNGLGNLVGIMPEPPGQEGIGPEEAEIHADVFAPRDAINFADWSTNSDNTARVLTAPAVTHPAYGDPIPFAGKVGHSTGLPGNGLAVTWGKGACSTVASTNVYEALGRAVPPLASGSGAGTAMNMITSLQMDIPSCDLGIYRATAIPSVHPSDLEVIVDSREYHELMVRAVVPYAEIFGVERPESIPRADKQVSRSELEVGTPFGLLGAASITDRETHPHEGIHFAGELQFNGQGTDTINYSDADMCGVRILGIMPNRSRTVWQELKNIAGERVAILGEVSVRNRDTTGNAVLNGAGKPDTSFLLRMPANTPYLMQAIDCEGRTLNTDQTWQHLRPGEMKTCGGCHVHSRKSETDFEDSYAATQAYAVAKLGEGTVPLLAGEDGGQVASRTVTGYGMQITLERDILPIFERRCVSCHGGSAPAAELALDRPGVDGLSANLHGVNQTDTPSTWWCLVADRAQECQPAERKFVANVTANPYIFRRPQLTRYIRAFNSLASLLYWKAAGRRTDGNTDDTFTDASGPNDRDIDFGPAHAHEITDEELGMISRWIDIGAPGGPMELLDTQKPTLHLGAILEGESVAELRVGTVDLGSGVAPESLTVCILGPNDACDDISGDAQLHGITPVALPGSLSDPDTEVLARVADVAGNVTEVRRTVGWLLNTPPPPPQMPPGGDETGGGTGGGDDGGEDAGGSGGATEGDSAGAGEGRGGGGGCGCTSGTPTSTWGLLLLGLTLPRRRRRN